MDFIQYTQMYPFTKKNGTSLQFFDVIFSSFWIVYMYPIVGTL